MRTTLDIDQDVLVAIKELANVQRISAGRVVSGLVRSALSGATADVAPRTVGGFRPFPSRGIPVTNDAINQIRDEEGL